MEHNLQKNIGSSFLAPIANSTYPILSSFPANDFVNPGLGQISRLYSFYVPLFNNNQSTYKIEKEIASENIEQLGAGNGVTNKTKEVDNSNDIDDPISFNEQKRKRLGDDVFDSFMHPKFVKTKKISIQNNPTHLKKTKSHSEKKTKNVNHQFKFY
jgi:hypothetical protein